MKMQTYALTPARIGKFKGDILKHAKPIEVLVKAGRQVDYPANSSDTYVARKFIPFGATSTNPNVFFQNATGDRSAAYVQQHQTQEGVTPAPDSIAALDVTEIINQYSCLYGFSDKIFKIYEDNIPAEMSTQVCERIALVNEMIVFGKLKGSTNQFFGGSGTTRVTTAGPLTLNLQSSIVRSLRANHAMPVTRMLAASVEFDTSAVASGYYGYAHTDLERMIRDLPNFVPAEKYASGTPEMGEIGKVEACRYILSPELIPYQDGGAAIASFTGAGAGFSTTGTSLDVYPIIYLGQDAFSQIAVKGMSIKPKFISPDDISKSDPLNQRGYAGAIWWKAVMVENPLWMAVCNVARSA